MSDTDDPDGEFELKLSRERYSVTVSKYAGPRELPTLRIATCDMVVSLYKIPLGDVAAIGEMLVKFAKEHVGNQP